MAGHKSFNEWKAKQSPDVLAGAARLSRELRAEILLSMVRDQQPMTPAEVAEALGIDPSSQTGVVPSDDLKVSTLRKLAMDLGARLEIAVVLTDGRRVDLTPPAVVVESQAATV